MTVPRQSGQKRAGAMRPTWPSAHAKYSLSRPAQNHWSGHAQSAQPTSEEGAQVACMQLTCSRPKTAPGRNPGKVAAMPPLQWGPLEAIQGTRAPAPPHMPAGPRKRWRTHSNLSGLQFPQTPPSGSPRLVTPFSRSPFRGGSRGQILLPAGESGRQESHPLPRPAEVTIGLLPGAV